MIDESVQIVCKICGYPPSESVKWMFRPCTNILRWDDCVASTETPQEIKVSKKCNNFF